MFGKKTSELEFEDIEYLVNIRKQREGYNLDYKKSIGNPDKAKNELAKDISAFANSSGGFLIFGIEDNLKICGVDKIVNNKSIDEWINQVVSSNIEPFVYYLDPKLIEIPDSDKIIVVIEIPESTTKPHFVKESFNYFIRINDSSKKANHSQIRDMFEFSRNRINDFDEFLNKRNLYDTESSNFGQNECSKTLYSKTKELVGLEKPIVLFSLIPKYPNREKIKVPFETLLEWLESNASGYEPNTSVPLYYWTYDYISKMEGLILNFNKNDKPYSYFEILNNGFVESGFSHTIVDYYCSKENEGKKSISLTPIVGYEMLLLSWAKKFYNFIEYYDEIVLQLSFVNVGNRKLSNFNLKHNELSIDKASNIYDNNFKLNYRFRPNELSTDKILSTAKTHSEKICRAFGLDKDYAFVDDILNTNEIEYFFKF